MYMGALAAVPRALTVLYLSQPSVVGLPHVHSVEAYSVCLILSMGPL
jgi:hypothetical protein